MFGECSKFQSSRKLKEVFHECLCFINFSCSQKAARLDNVGANTVYTSHNYSSGAFEYNHLKQQN